MNKLGKIGVFVTLVAVLFLFSCSNPSSSRNGSGSNNDSGATPTSDDNPGNTPTNTSGDNGNQTVYYIVTFDSMGGTPIESQRVVQGEKASKPNPDPTREEDETVSYSFGNWYLSNDNGTTLSDSAFDFENTSITANITLYAKWLENAIPATFMVKHYKQNIYGNGYEEVTTDRQTISGYVGEHTTASAKSYEGFTPQNIIQKTILANNSVVIEIYYNRNTYSVTYEDGVEDIVITVPNVSTYKYGETVNLVFSGIGTNEGYSFVGWTDGTTIYKSDETTTFIMGTDNITLIAKWIYQFTEEPKNLGNGYYLFGDFPQSEKVSNVIIDESQNITKGDFIYYLGNDGNYYVKVNNHFYNEMRYYKVEPIKWKMLTNEYSGKKLLFADKTLTCCAYYDYDETRGENVTANPIYRNNYKESRVRAYLNGISYKIRTTAAGPDENKTEFNKKGFLYSAFTSEAIRKIATTNVVNDARSTNPNNKYNQWNNGKNDYACSTTSDKIFLLSVQEITNSSYGFDEDYDADTTSRLREPTDFCWAINTEGSYLHWWLRSPYSGDTVRARVVRFEGSNSYFGAISTQRSEDEYGVVPALCLN